jgi:hypothetical protein
LVNTQQELGDKKEKLRDAEEQLKKAGDGKDGQEFIKGMVKDNQN